MTKMEISRQCVVGGGQLAVSPLCSCRLFLCAHFFVGEDNARSSAQFIAQKKIFFLSCEIFSFFSQAIWRCVLFALVPAEVFWRSHSAQYVRGGALTIE